MLDDIHHRLLKIGTDGLFEVKIVRRRTSNMSEKQWGLKHHLPRNFIPLSLRDHWYTHEGRLAC